LDATSRLLTPKKGAAPVALVSYGYWKQHLGSSSDLSQLHLKIDNGIFSVIGVLPVDFQFPANTDLFIPADRDGENPSRTSHNYDAVAVSETELLHSKRMPKSAPSPAAIHDTSTEQGRLSQQGRSRRPLQTSMTGATRPALLILLGAVGFLSS